MANATPSVSCPLRSASLTAPDATALVSAQGAISYEALDLALIRAGHVACPISDRLPARGVAPLLERAACSALISEDEDLLQTAGADLLMLGTDALLEKVLQSSSDRSESIDLPRGRPATIIFTSGSTGVPKAALHTFGNHYYSALGSNANITLRPGDRWLHSLPLYHVGGLSILFRCLFAGATVALPRPGTSLGTGIASLGATHVSLVSTQLSRLLQEDANLGGLQAILMGGGPVPTRLVDEA